MIKTGGGILLLLFSFTVSFSQIENKQDYMWIWNNDPGQAGNEAYIFDFNRGSSTKPLGRLNNIAFSGNSASICDRDGNLLLYSNGCEVADSTHQVMPNGSGLNAGEFIEIYRDGDCDNGYPGRQDILILPDPGNEKGYYVLHKEIILTDEEDYRNLMYSYVDMNLNDRSGDVVDKNVLIGDSDTKYMYDYLTAIPHKNGEDFWVIQPLDKLDSIYVFLLKEEGITKYKSVSTPFPFQFFSSASGTAALSPDGSKYALFSAYDNLLLYDFVRRKC